MLRIKEKLEGIPHSFPHACTLEIGNFQLKKLVRGRCKAFLKGAYLQGDIAGHKIKGGIDATLFGDDMHRHQPLYFRYWPNPCCWSHCTVGVSWLGSLLSTCQA